MKTTAPLLLTVSCAVTVAMTAIAGANAMRTPAARAQDTAARQPIEDFPLIRLPFSQGDPQQAIDKMLAASNKDGKSVFVNFGADWCIDCRVLERLLQTQRVKSFLESNFNVVTVDVDVYFESDKQKNGNIAARYGLNLLKSGIPAIVVLSPDGRVVGSTNDGQWQSARTFTADDVLSSLRQWARRR